MHELVIKSTPTKVDIALLSNKKLIELHCEDGENDKFNVGDIYLGKVHKLVPSLNAAFVDVGYEKDAFLHYHDLGVQYKTVSKYVKNTISGKQTTAKLAYNKLERGIEKDGKIKDNLSSKQLIAVQITKEPISSKGPRLSAEITLAGRFLILAPFSDKISIYTSLYSGLSVRQAKNRES